MTRTMLIASLAAALWLSAPAGGADRAPGGRPAPLSPNAATGREPARGPLRVHPENPRYFTDGSGRAVVLSGSHTWSNLVDMGPDDPPAPFDFGAYLDWLERRGHNFIRLWTWELTTWDTTRNGPRLRKDRVHHVTPHPWARTGPGMALDGKPRFDLEKFDRRYFERLRTRARAAGRRGIYVSVMLFEGWGLQFAPGAWKSHPFHPRNNSSGIDGDKDGDGKGLEVHTLADPRITAIQERYVRKVIDTVGDLDNVLWEISNENHPASTPWQYHMIDLIHEIEQARPKQHPVGMTFQYRGGENETLLESPAEWVSPNREGGYRDDPPRADGRKVIISDTDHLWGVGGNADWVWKSFLRGLHPIFMDPYDGSVLGEDRPAWEPIRKAMGRTLELAGRVNLAAMSPRGDLASSRYCLADRGREYLVYVPQGSVTVDLGGAPDALTVEWIEASTGRRRQAANVSGDARVELESPFEGRSVAHLRTENPPSAGAPGLREPLFRTVDLDIGDERQVELADGSTVRVKLLELEEKRDPIRDAVREAVVEVEVDGEEVRLVSANYRLPVTVGGVRIDCPITRGYTTNSRSRVWGLERAARLRLWPAGSPLIAPGTFVYPARQRWFASLTQMANEPTYVDAGEVPATPRIYYHYGLDIGGAEGLVDLVAATSGLVVSSGTDRLAGHDDTPVSPRYDVVYILDDRGWYYRYSHLKEIEPRIVPGAKVEIGEKIGVLGKEGGSGGWSHLHFDISSRQPSGEWGIEEGYGFLWEAYLREYAPELIAVARPHHVALTGETVKLNGSRSWSAKDEELRFEWTFTDGSRAEGSVVERAYEAPGEYSEVLTVTDEHGRIARDFAVVQVFDRKEPRPLSTIHSAYSPTFGIRAGDPVTFKVRSFGWKGGETWNFGDGSPPVEVRSDGNEKVHAEDGYAVTTHRFEKPGDYVVRVEHRNAEGIPAVTHLHVRVGPKNGAKKEVENDPKSDPRKNAKEGEEASAPVYPGKTWARKTPQEAGMDTAKLRAFSDFVGGRGCVVRGGCLVHTWGDVSRRADVASAAKPWYSHFLFLALGEEKIPSLDERVARWEPRLTELNEPLGHPDRRITWRHLANQTSCYQLTERPGTAFAYNDWQMALFFDTLFLKVWDTTYEDVDEEVLHPLLTEPLQCEDDPTFLAFGTEDRPGRLAVSARDFARFGLLYLRKGRWRGKELLDPEHARRAVSSPLPNSIPRASGKAARMIPGQRSIGSRREPDNQTDHFGSYSWLWWTNGVDRDGTRMWPDAPEDTFGAFGHGGPRAMWVMPGLDVVVSYNDAKLQGWRSGDSPTNRAMKLLVEAVDGAGRR